MALSNGDTLASERATTTAAKSGKSSSPSSKQISRIGGTNWEILMTLPLLAWWSGRCRWNHRRRKVSISDLVNCLNCLSCAFNCEHRRLGYDYPSLVTVLGRTLKWVSRDRKTTRKEKWAVKSSSATTILISRRSPGVKPVKNFGVFKNGGCYASDAISHVKTILQADKTLTQ